MTEDERREAERLAKENHFTNGPGHCEGVAFVRGYEIACATKDHEIASLEISLAVLSQDLKKEKERVTTLLEQLSALYSNSRAVFKDLENEIDRRLTLAKFLTQLSLKQTPQTMMTEFWVEVSHELEKR